jgi:hypothetical protein
MNTPRSQMHKDAGMKRILFAGLVVPVLTIAGCDRPAQPDAALAAPAPAVVDSVLPIEEETKRFRATLGEEPTQLAGGAATRDELVRRFITAIETHDLGALAELRLSRAEFAYLYYPHTRYTRRPYQLSPAIVWFQLENHGSKGISRVLRRYGGQALGALDYECPDPETEGPNRVWADCAVRHTDDAGDTVLLRILGPIVEHDGLYKFVSYANRM